LCLVMSVRVWMLITGHW